IASQTLTEPVVNLWDGATGKRLGALPIPGSHAELAMTPDGRRLAALVTGAAVVKLWDAADGHEVGSFRVPATGLGFALTADGNRVAVGLEDGTVRLFAAA